MRTNEQSNTKSPSEKSGTPPALLNIEDELIQAQLLQRLERIERALVSMDSRVGERLDAIEARLSTGRAGVSRKIVEKPNIRNTLMNLMQKGWLSEPEAMEKTGWQTIGIRSFVTKLGSLGLSVETEERDGVRFYRIAK